MRVALRANAAALLQLGLDPTIELGIGRVSFSAKARLVNAGVAMSGPYVGGLYERYTIRVWNPGPNVYVNGILSSSGQRTVTVTVANAIEAEGGYRWAWGSFIMDVGDKIGYGLIETSYNETDQGVRQEDRREDNRFLGEADLNLGIRF